jgi:hypothetical protein
LHKAINSQLQGLVNIGTIFVCRGKGKRPVKNLNMFGFIVVMIVLMLIGGGLTAQLQSGTGDGAIPFVIRQSNDPEASAIDAAPWQVEQLVLFIGFVLSSLIGLGGGIALLLWFLDKSVRQAKAAPTTAASTAIAPAQQSGVTSGAGPGE